MYAIPQHELVRKKKDWSEVFKLQDVVAKEEFERKYKLSSQGRREKKIGLVQARIIEALRKNIGSELTLAEISDLIECNTGHTFQSIKRLLCSGLIQALTFVANNGKPLALPTTRRYVYKLTATGLAVNTKHAWDTGNSRMTKRQQDVLNLLSKNKGVKMYVKEIAAEIGVEVPLAANSINALYRKKMIKRAMTNRVSNCNQFMYRYYLD